MQAFSDSLGRCVEKKQVRRPAVLTLCVTTLSRKREHMKRNGNLIGINRVCLCVYGCAVIYAASVYANPYEHLSDAKGSVFDSSIRKDSVSTLEAVEVSSHRIAKEVASTAPTFKLSAERMKLLGITDIADALHRIPGINLKDYGGAGGLKTVSVRGFGDQHTGVIYDGVVLSDAQSGRIDLSRYSLDNVASLSMVVGDNSDIFIPAKWAASAASVVIESEQINLSDSLVRVTAQLRAGSFSMVNPYLKLSKRIGKRLALSAIGEYTYAKNDYPFILQNGYTYTHERRSNSRMKSGHAELSAKLGFDNGSSLQGKVFYYDNGRQLPGQVILYNPTNNEYLRERNFFSQLSFKSSSSSTLRYQAIAKYNWDASYYSNKDGKYPGGILIEDYRQREGYLSNSILFSPTQTIAVNYSADAFCNYLTGNNQEIVNPSRLSLLQTISAKYSTSRFQIMARGLWSIYHNKVEKGEAASDANRLSPSLSLSWQPLEDRFLFLRASYKNIFRMPTFTEAYYFRLGNVTLRPETTDQVNLGLTWQKNNFSLFETVSLTADCYANRVVDKIVALPQNMYVWRMVNMGRVRSLGVDVTTNCVAKLNSTQKLMIAGNYSFQRVQPRTNPTALDYNKQLAYTPMNTGGASVSWLNPWVDVVFNTIAVGERYANSINLPISRLSPYTESGLSLMRGFKLRSGLLDLRLDIQNMFNVQYEIINDYPMPGINWKFTIKYTL